MLSETKIIKNTRLSFALTKKYSRPTNNNEIPRHVIIISHNVK